MSRFLNPALFLLATCLSFSLLYINIGITSIQQVVVLLLLLLLIFINRYFFAKNTPILTSLLKSIFVLCTALFTQLLVISTGGLGSPFLILIHVFTIGATFLLSLLSGLSFLFFCAVLLSLNIYLNESLRQIILEDVGTHLLYGASFLVIVPTSILVSKYYYLKDSLAGLLRKQLQQKENIHQVVLSGISEMVLVVDTGYHIISLNDVVEKELSLPKSEILYKSLFDVLFLKESGGGLITPQSLGLDGVVSAKIGKIVKDLQLLSRNRALPRKVNLVIKPVTNFEGGVEQITFVISDSASASQNNEHASIEEARMRYQVMIDELKVKLLAQGMQGLRIRAELIRRSETDIIEAIEMGHHQFTPSPSLVDLAKMCQSAVILEQDFAKSLGVEVQFSLPNFGPEIVASLVPAGMKVDPEALTAPFYTAPIDVKWFDLLIQKLLNVSVLLSSGTTSSKVSLILERLGSNYLLIKIVSVIRISDYDKNFLLTQYYGTLGQNTNLKLSSGLEGYLAKNIAALLHLPIKIELSSNPSEVVFSLTVTKDVPGRAA